MPLGFLGLAAEERGHVQVVRGDIPDILLDLVHDVRRLGRLLGKLALNPP